MQVPELIKQTKSGIVSITFYIDGARVSSGSGFICRDRMISNNHIFLTPDGAALPEKTTVKLKFGNTADDLFVVEKSYNDFMNTLEVGSPKELNDYAVFDITTFCSLEGRHQFELALYSEVIEGSHVVIQGFPFGIQRMTTHSGIVSTKFENSFIKTIQIDASVNNGNSGGPLIDLQSGNVVGIVTRKLSGLERSFDELIQSFEKNIQQLQAIGSSGMAVQFGGMDLFQSMAITQNQMKIISQNLKRSANVGIGYAFACDGLINENFYKKS